MAKVVKTVEEVPDKEVVVEHDHDHAPRSNGVVIAVVIGIILLLLLLFGGGLIGGGGSDETQAPAPAGQQ